MKLTIKQFNNLKKFIKQENNLKTVYSSVKLLTFNSYYNNYMFEFQAVDFKGNIYNDIIRFETKELSEIINK